MSAKGKNSSVTPVWQSDFKPTFYIVLFFSNSVRGKFNKKYNSSITEMSQKRKQE